MCMHKRVNYDRAERPEEIGVQSTASIELPFLKRQLLVRRDELLRKSRAISVINLMCDCVYNDPFCLYEFMFHITLPYYPLCYNNWALRGLIHESAAVSSESAKLQDFRRAEFWIIRDDELGGEGWEAKREGGNGDETGNAREIERDRRGGCRGVEGERVRVVAEQPLEMQIFGTICRYVGETEMRTLRPQVNSTEIDNPRTWATYSVCEILAERSRYGQPIRCVAIHPAYANPTMSSSIEVRFDVRCK